MTDDLDALEAKAQKYGLTLADTKSLIQRVRSAEKENREFDEAVTLEADKAQARAEAAEAKLVRMGYAEDAGRQLEIARAGWDRAEADNARLRDALGQVGGQEITFEGCTVVTVSPEAVEACRAALAGAEPCDHLARSVIFLARAAKAEAREAVLREAVLAGAPFGGDYDADRAVVKWWREVACPALASEGAAAGDVLKAAVECSTGYCTQRLRAAVDRWKGGRDA